MHPVSSPDSRFLDSFANEVSKAKIDYCEIRQGDAVLFAHCRDPHNPGKLHKVNSITKSVVSLLIGIAIDRGELENVHTAVSDYIPSCERQDLTIEHLLTMTDGWDWREWGDWGGLPKPMTGSPNWIRYIVDREIVHPAGRHMAYSSGSSHLLSAILQKATGMTTDKYAERHLFGPLGIEEYRWQSDPQGIVIGGFSLELPAADITKLGLLALNNGRWNGRSVVSSEWIGQSTRPLYLTYPHVGHYGYHWWVLPAPNGGAPRIPTVFFAMGYGGQFLYVVPEHRLVAAFASSLYKDSFLPHRLFLSQLLPAFERK
ncbi:serine hydrolase domain-containing protein [Cohnella faecalis]|uniref:Class C beta-lactamase-related serine hydrolase n=1 Tax=Cohnella faecalis TaxID=2315694 RepID=A0A398CN71_9BACL|nr:serine hydrolase [Cohnella faecalis]RIE04806.1 class C beta-lactamase-related serine hydrolase [Cohnella faecalis]